MARKQNLVNIYVPYKQMFEQMLNVRTHRIVLMKCGATLSLVNRVKIVIYLHG